MLQFRNQANRKVEIFWVDSTVATSSPNALVSMGPPIEPDASLGLDSYNGHQFLVRLVPHISGVETKFRKGKEPEDIILTYDTKRKSLKAQSVKQAHEIKDKVQSGFIDDDMLKSFEGIKSADAKFQIQEDVARAFIFCTRGNSWAVKKK